jgi:hypothetical protein
MLNLPLRVYPSEAGATPALPLALLGAGIRGGLAMISIEYFRSL